MDQYCRVNVLYLLSMLAHAYNTIIDRGVGAPGHGREVVGGLSYTEKWFISILIITVQLPSAASCESQMAMHTSTSNTDISLAREFQKHLSDLTWEHGLLDLGKYVKCASKWNWNERDYHVQDNKDV